MIDLHEHIGSIEALEILDEVRREKNYAEFAEHLFDEDERVARNAGWVLNKAKRTELLALVPMLDRLTDLALKTPSSSVRRLTLAVIERLPMKEEDLRSDLLDFCLWGMRSMDEPAGVQSLCMKLAYRMCAFYPELMGEFQRTVECMEVEQYTPGLRCVIKKVKAGRFC